MAKKKKSTVQKSERRKEQDNGRELWLLRLKVGTGYVIIWFVILLWMTNHLPNPVTSQYFYQNSSAHWFINIGLAIMFFVVQYELGRQHKAAGKENTAEGQ